MVDNDPNLVLLWSKKLGTPHISPSLGSMIFFFLAGML